MDKAVGLCIVGMNGAVATTSICGLELIKKGKASDSCLISSAYIDTDKRSIEAVRASERSFSISKEMDLCGLDKIIIGGWDINEDSIYISARRNNIIDKDLIELVRGETEKLIPWKGYDINTINENNYIEMARRISEDIINFRIRNNIKNVIVLNLQPTERYLKTADTYLNLEKFEDALGENHESINNSMIYSYAALNAGAGYIEFTPNTSIDTLALISLAREKNLPVCGKDGKTGQTFIKSVLAQAFRSRQLRIDGWYSTNILGNNDGRNLSDPSACESKIVSKKKLLDKIMGYKIDNHIINIVYYPPRGDNKEAWDNIDLKGFLDMPMQIKIDFLCKDSILAAPIIIDLIRFMDYALDKGMYGYQSWLALFFKQALFNEADISCFGFFEQEKLFVDFILNEIWSRQNLVEECKM